MIIVALASCKGDEPAVQTPLYRSMVTYTGQSAADSNVAVFSFREAGDSPEVTLTAAWSPSTDADIKPGRRLLITYYCEEYGRSGNISLASEPYKVPGGKILVPDNGMIFPPESIELKSVAVARSGEYINLYATVQTNRDTAVELGLFLDPSTANDAVPKAYVRVKANDVAIDAIAWPLYASWDISDIWDKPSVTGVDIMVKNATGDFTAYSTTKENLTD